MKNDKLTELEQLKAKIADQELIIAGLRNLALIPEDYVLTVDNGVVRVHQALVIEVPTAKSEI